MKILHIAETVWGGCGTYLNEIVPLQIDRLGAHNLRCIVPMQHLAHLSDIPDEIIDGFDRPSRKTGLLRLAWATRAAVRAWQPDVIHAHSTFAGAVVRAMSCVQSMPPIVYCAHGWVFDVARWPQVRRMTEAAERVLSHRAKRIVAISQAERFSGERAGIRADKLVVVANGISPKVPTQRAEWSDPRIKLLFVGRLDRQKGVDVLLDAVSDLQNHIALRIVGEQVVSGAPSLAAANTLAHVEFLGWQDKQGVAAQLNACDAVVMPSRWEGFGLVAVEAMRAGKPVIASAIGGLPEIVLHDITGHLVQPDNAHALAATLATLNADRLEHMGRAGYARFLECFTSKRTNDGLMQVYAEALHGSARAGTYAKPQAGRIG